MSLISRKSSKLNKNKNGSYVIYCINVHGTGLTSIRDTFLKQVQTGTRRTIFAVDLDAEIIQRQKMEEQSDYKRGKLSMSHNIGQHPALVALSCIDNCRTEYNRITEELEAEMKFNIIDFWLKEGESKINFLSNANTMNEQSKQNVSKNKKTNRVTKESVMFIEGSCPTFKPREHNRVGRPKKLMSIDFINDSPFAPKLIIIFIGKINRNFIYDLIGYKEPLKGVIDLLPEKSEWDLLMPSTNIETFLSNTLEGISLKYLELRQANNTKTVGLFKESIPVLSICLANKYKAEIFDQLTWYLMDLELTWDHYLKYYVNAFQLTNVSLDKHVQLQLTNLSLESLSIQGHFMRNAISAAAPDIASVAMYLDSLLNTIDLPADLPDEVEAMLLSQPVSRSIIIINSETLHSAKEKYLNSFVSITKIRKYERIIVEKSNKLLDELIEYSNHDFHSNIYLTTLEYNVLRTYVINAWNPDCEPYVSYDLKNLTYKILPNYVKFLGTEDSLLQNLNEMIYEYDDYLIEEIVRNTKLYTFQRTYNKVVEKESMMVLPSLLCYRDFTIFQLEEFNENITRPPVEYKKFIRPTLTISPRQSNARKSTKSRLSNASSISHQPITNIFIRPNSLKARGYSVANGSQIADQLTIDKMLNHFADSDKLMNQQVTTKLLNQSNMNEKEDIYGLPENHKLLQGYNLDDTRQEVFVNTSCYHFEEGYIKFYRERWCFATMNRYIHLNINNNIIKFISNRDNDASVIRNLHIITKSNIQIRILADDNGGPKIVINYPNGLAIYKYELFVEQFWVKEETYQQEERRLYTSCGSVIIFYKNLDSILVMRFNGEVYQLFNYDLPVDGEEEFFHEEEEEDQSVVNPKKNVDFKELNVDVLLNTSSIDEQPTKSTLSTKKEQIINSISEELNFIDNLTKMYDLSYLHLILTTSVGRIVNITSTGRVYQGRNLWNNEWHDYFANEAYAQRENGVKCIWNENGLKCFHHNGTIIASTIIESILEMEDFDIDISQSSSHNNLTESNRTDEKKWENELQYNSKSDYDYNIYSSAEPLNPGPYDYEEEEEKEDTSYVVYDILSFIIQHRNYAEVQVILHATNTENTKSIYMEINGLDQIRASASFFQCDAMPRLATPDEEHEIENENTTPKSEFIKNFNILICFDSCITLSITKDYCDLTTLLGRDSDNSRPIYFPFTFKLHFEADVDGLFNKLVMALATFKNYKQNITEKHYFLERFDDKHRRQGFKFYNNLPILSPFNYAVSNTVTEFIELQPTDDKFANNDKYLKIEMKKFPRFPNSYQKKYKSDDEILPLILGVNLYINIPQDMRYTDNIGKFLEPFGNLTYKKTRKQMREALTNILNPIFNVKMHLLYSHNSWEIRKLWHQRRLIIEEQRKFLYFAMLKHKKYIKYHKFYEVFDGHVKNIDFFDFVKYQCMGEIEKQNNISSK